jgi:prepilin-type N-terminal cleavage/methylation domain-containing protein
MDRKGFTLVELLITLAIIGILAGVAAVTYIGTIKRGARMEATTNIEALYLLENKYFDDNGEYISLGTCGHDIDNIAEIQEALPDFRPGDPETLNYSYCIQANIDVNGNTQIPCFRVSAFGNSNTSVKCDVFRIDCNNRQSYTESCP